MLVQQFPYQPPFFEEVYDAQIPYRCGEYIVKQMHAAEKKSQNFEQKIISIQIRQMNDEIQYINRINHKCVHC